MRDETGTACRLCGARLPAAGRGRRRVYCSRACQAKAYRHRRESTRSRPARPPRGSAITAARARRRQIAEAVWRIAATRGLHAASMREVATEAGVSVRVVQYHFGGKHALLVEALRLLHADNEQRAQTRITTDLTDPRAVLRGILEEFLPLDEPRRVAWRVLAAYYAYSLVDPELAKVFQQNDRDLERFVATLIERAQHDGSAADPEREAEMLMSCAVGLGSDLLHGRRTTEATHAVLDYHLDRLFVT